jgi:hypothetical protein
VPPEAAVSAPGTAHPSGLPSRRHTVSNTSRKWKDAAGGTGNGSGVPVCKAHLPIRRRSLDESRSVASSSMSDLDTIGQPCPSSSGSGQQPAAPLRPKTPFEVLTAQPPVSGVGGGLPSCSTSTSTGGQLPTASSSDHPLQQRLAAVGLHLPLFDSISGGRPAASSSPSVNSGFWLFGGRKNSQNQVQQSQDSSSSTQSPGTDLVQRQPSQGAGQPSLPAAAMGFEKPAPPLPPPPEPSVGVRSRMLQSSERLSCGLADHPCAMLRFCATQAVCKLSHCTSSASLLLVELVGVVVGQAACSNSYSLGYIARICVQAYTS